MSSQSSEMGEVRIIGGDWRGRKLPVLQAEGLRPTSDRVRETLFNWLQFEVPGARCLDLFAGSGALGFEALSRGAHHVCFLELSADNAAQLEANATRLKCESSEVVRTDALRWLLEASERAFDIVFIDPPFHQGLMQPALDALFAHHWLAEDAWLYLEQEQDAEWPDLPEYCRLYREKTTSQVKYALFRCEVG
ncbi:16S rRNA (guanine(966)-N(2))-methyltransferase RsmD [Thiomicrorhabdus sp.]|uniref:16S rRNA (guanine(966)-N(2))-methyltransferase RsmD n=1 Tax=Thiomicrorhabdus sp. TaxID=2039724 RepID=UPI003747F504